MHIVIGIITAAAGLIWALHSLQHSGVDLNSFNPFTWARRRKWEKLHGTKPLHNLTHPMDAAAALIVGLLKQEGEISREQKQAVLEIFENDFHLNKPKAIELFSASVYLVKDEINFDQSVKKILAPSKDSFTPEQAESVVSLLHKIATLEGEATESQQKIIQQTRELFNVTNSTSSAWG